MTDDEIKPKVAAGTVAVAGAALLATSPPMAIAAAGVALAPQVIEPWVRWRERHRERRIREMLAGYLEGMPVEDEAYVEATLQSLADDPTVREVLADAFRVIDEASASEAVLAMGRLVRSYQIERRPADWFSRGVRRLLSDISSDDYVALKELLALLADVQSTEDRAAVRLVERAPGPLITIWYAAEELKGLPKKAVVTNTENTKRALELLKRSSLAREGSSGGDRRTFGDPNMEVALTVARRLFSMMK
jgi:hypothetical protein